MTPVVAQDSKAEIFNAFQKILARQTPRVATREEEAEQAKSREVLETVSQYTADSIVRGLADLQLEFGTIVTGLSDRLTSETNKLDDLKRAIAVETTTLQELQDTHIVADVLYLRTQEHQETLRLLEQQSERDRETLEQEVAQTRKLWQQEQAEFASNATETSEILDRVRQRQEADYVYETERSRTLTSDQYEAARRQLEREIQETAQMKQKNWVDREQVLTSNQTTLEENQRKVTAFPPELEEAVKKSREEGIRDANQDAKVRADLIAKEWESDQQGYEFQIQSLEAKIQQQSTQISEITTQLQTALRQAQDLALRAFENSANRSTARSE